MATASFRRLLDIRNVDCYYWPQPPNVRPKIAHCCDVCGRRFSALALLNLFSQGVRGAQILLFLTLCVPQYQAGCVL